MRLFVSVDLPSDLVEPIADLQEEFARADGLRFTDPEQAHLTLKFLGEASEEHLEEVSAAIERGVEESEVSPFVAQFGGLGVFPSLEYISVVWFGVEEGAGDLRRLHEAIEARTVGVGFDPEEHEFTPHVTLARMDHAGGKEVVQEVVTGRAPVVGEMHVEEVRLTESSLTPEGPVYSTVERFRL
jgi:RNA 2',3'-cyclic 3'-phosphodiesterase